MKKLSLFLILFSSFAFGQKVVSDEKINRVIDSLKIDYKPQIEPYLNAKKVFVDNLNLLILNGKYDKNTVKEITTYINKEQDLYQFQKDIPNEKAALELKDAIVEAIHTGIMLEKTKILANYYSKLADDIDEKNYQRTMTFLRETNYNPAEFRKLSPDEREKLVIEFENKKK